MRDEAEQVRAVERERLRALVGADMPAARAVHAADLQLVSPHGQMLSKDQYLGGIASTTAGSSRSLRSGRSSRVRSR